MTVLVTEVRDHFIQFVKWIQRLRNRYETEPEFQRPSAKTSAPLEAESRMISPQAGHMV